MVTKRSHFFLEAGLLVSVWSRDVVLCVQWEVLQRAEPWCGRLHLLTEDHRSCCWTETSRPTGVCGRIGPLPEQFWEAPHWPQLQRHSLGSPDTLLPLAGFVPVLPVNSVLFLCTSSYSSVPSSSQILGSPDWTMAWCQFCGTHCPPLTLPQPVTPLLLKRA